jgi:hypothetical protein
VPRVGFAMISLKELVMAELSPWRMKDITTIPINGRTISKNRRSARLPSRLLYHMADIPTGEARAHSGLLACGMRFCTIST